MNCYTVTAATVHLGIALSGKVGDFHLLLGKKKILDERNSNGDERKIILSPRDPASWVLMAGGAYVVRTAGLLKTEEPDPRHFLVKAKSGLKPDGTDPRALVLLDYQNERTAPGHTPNNYGSIPVAGFECIEPLGHRYRVQALVVLGPNQYIHYRDEEVGESYTVTYDQADDAKFPSLRCITLAQFHARKKLIAV